MALGDGRRKMKGNRKKREREGRLDEGGRENKSDRTMRGREERGAAEKRIRGAKLEKAGTVTSSHILLNSQR